MKDEIIFEVLEQFSTQGIVGDVAPYGNGHINDTYLVVFTKGEVPRKVIMQKMNTNIFKEPVQLMENILAVTAFLKDRIIEMGGDPRRETLHVVKTDAGEAYFIDRLGGFWRAYDFIDHAFCYDLVEDASVFYQSGLAFGNFQCLLSSFPAETLHETIPNFHNTAVRLLTFKEQIAQDSVGRVKDVEVEIAFFLSREKYAYIFGEALEKGEIIRRVTHNDTKLNNVMIDETTAKGLCVIDLDTVMPGFAMHDFGDAIRFGASTALEDEKDLDKVHFDINLFRAFSKGFLESCGKSLSKCEIDLLPLGAIVMTYECGIRFLGDYLAGDLYFKTHREGHNLDRARTQMKLVSEMEEKLEEMLEIVHAYT